MNHPVSQEELFAFYDGELAGDAKQAVEAHLPLCADCRGLLSQWKQAAQTAFQPAEIAIPEAFVERVMQRLNPPAVQRFQLLPRLLEGRWLIPAGALAAALVFAISSLLQQTVSVDSLLLSTERDEDVLALLMEDPA